MTFPVTLQYSFAGGTGNRKLSQLDADLAALRDALNGIGNGSSLLTSAFLNTADMGTANVATVSFSSAIGGNVIILGGTADFANLALAGPLQSGSGGTGIASYTDGQLLIGSNLTSGLVAVKITAGAGTIVNTAPGTITVSSNGVSTATQLRKAIFTSSGTFTPNATTMHKIIVIGGGGAGGSVPLLLDRVSGGGGAGAAAISWNLLTSGVGITVTIGAGGANTSGGNSVVVLPTTNIVSAGGTVGDAIISGGIGNSIVGGGVGGAAFNGIINMSGNNGATAFMPNVHAFNISISGFGADSFLGMGGAGRYNVQARGRDGTGFGSGGGGSACTHSVAVALPGGNGSPGIVIFEWLA